MKRVGVHDRPARAAALAAGAVFQLTRTLRLGPARLDSHCRLKAKFDDLRPNAIIVATLDAMRDALTRATAQKPCFRNTTPADENDSFAFSVAVNEDLRASLEFTIAAFDAHAGTDRQVSSGNTITVSFRPKSF